jgi:hypothetical protein
VPEIEAPSQAKPGSSIQVGRPEDTAGEQTQAVEALPPRKPTKSETVVPPDQTFSSVSQAT